MPSGPLNNAQEIIAEILRPAGDCETRSSAVWHICERLRTVCLDLIAQGRSNDAAVVAVEIADQTKGNAWISNTAADIVQWSNWQVCDPTLVSKSLTLAQAGQFAWCMELDKLDISRRKLPFFIAALMPKSGGTYIANVLNVGYGYRTDIYYSFGDANDNFISEERVEGLLQAGGVFNHTHISPNTWNFKTIKKTQAPFWLHVRDPRDAYFSLINMVRKEKTRDGASTEAFYRSINAAIGVASAAETLTNTQLALLLYENFERYCSFLERWLCFDYSRKLVTSHAMLLDNEDQFFSLVADFVGLQRQSNVTVEKDYETSRFDRGTNGRWQSEFSKPLQERMEKRMESSGLVELLDRLR